MTSQPRSFGPGFYTMQQDGMVKRWCFNKIGYRCSHFIAPRYEPVETESCPEDDRNYYWFMVESDPFSIDQEMMTAFVKHQLRCLYCLHDTNCYLFPGYYDVQEDLVDRFLELYHANYPRDLVQPSIFVVYNNTLEIRLRCDFGEKGEGGVAGGDLSLDTMSAAFWVCTATDPEITFESFIFDLSQKSGWAGMLRVFPQLGRADPVLVGE